MTEEGISSVLGTVLMLGMIITLIPGGMMLHSAIRDEFDAERERAEKAAFCARNPQVGEPTCKAQGPLPGYSCRQVEADAWVCARDDDAVNDLYERASEPPTNDTQTATPPTLPL